MERKIKLYGKELKIALIEGQIDKANKCKISVGRFLENIGQDIGFCRSKKTGRVERSNYNFWAKKDEVVYSDPYYGEAVTEKLIYKYAIDNNYWTKYDLTYEDFTKNTQNKKVKYDEEYVVKKVRERFNYPVKFDIFKISTIINTLKVLYGAEAIEKALNSERRLVSKNGKN